MPTHILTWNPATWGWDDLFDVLDHVDAGESIELTWSAGNTTSIPIGSRVFLLKQGPEPRGIMASGWTTRPVEKLPHWDPDRAARGDVGKFVTFVPELMLNPDEDGLLDPRAFPPGAVREAYWAPTASGNSIPDGAAQHLEQLWAAHVDGMHQLGEPDIEITAFEGAIRYAFVRHRSRERALRNAKLQQALADGPLRCEVPGCGFDFAKRYGNIGEGYAQVHHLIPLSERDTAVETRLADLAIVCANCHAMIHRGGGSRALDELIARENPGQ